jgi:hypothetical protein
MRIAKTVVKQLLTVSVMSTVMKGDPLTIRYTKYADTSAESTIRVFGMETLLGWIRGGFHPGGGFISPWGCGADLRGDCEGLVDAYREFCAGNLRHSDGVLNWNRGVTKALAREAEGRLHAMVKGLERLPVHSFGDSIGAAKLHSTRK